MVFLQSELTRRQKGKESSGRSSGTANWRRGILGELNRIHEPDSAVVPKGLFGRGAQFARDILRIERAVELDSRKDPHLDHGYAMTSHSSHGQTADRVLIQVDAELSAKCPLNSRMAYVSVSRARHDGQLFTNDRETLNAALGNDVPTKVRMDRKRRTTPSRAAVLLIKGHAGSGPHCDVCSSFFRRTN